jgi:hypothetical protein
LITGNYSGGLNYYSSKPPPLVMATYEKPFPGNKNACTVYPVPADASVTLLITGFHPGETYIARIVNLAGQTVMTVHPQHPSTIIQTAALPAGFYLLMITGPTDNGTISLTAQKVIIRH